jgi:hypothetical protein
LKVDFAQAVQGHGEVALEVERGEVACLPGLRFRV